MLDLSSFDLEEIGNALADQTDYEHRWLINPQTGEIAFWNADTGIDGQTPVDLDDGWLTIRSSMTMLPAVSWSPIPIPICRDPLMPPRNEDSMSSPAGD
jgi:hypothetical protein